jgi:hypothetical protein
VEQNPKTLQSFDTSITFTLERNTYIDKRLAVLAAISLEIKRANRSSEEESLGANVSQALASNLPFGLQYPTNLTEDGVRAISGEMVLFRPKTELVS